MDKFKFINGFYVKNNIKIFPLYNNDKKPMINAWQRDCSSDLRQILYWLKDGNNCNFGMPANENDLFIIDIDMHGDVNGLENFKKLCDFLGIDLPNTLKQTTPSGGIHYIFKSDDELKQVTNSANCFKDYPGIDIRTKGYIAVEPSVINGVPYKFDFEYDIMEMPKELRDFILNNNNHYKENKKKFGYIKPEKVEQGGRDIALFEYIMNLYHNTKLSCEEITVLASYFNQEVCSPPLANRDVVYKVNRIFKQPRNEFILLKISNSDEDK